MDETVRLRSVYATDVFHYAHVLQAMSSEFDAVDLVRRAELTQQEFDKVKRLIPPRFASIVGRRVVDPPSPAPTRSASLGAAQLVFPISARIGWAPSERIYRLTKRTYARRVDRIANDNKSPAPQLFQFIEGLGVQALRKLTDATTTVMERRHLHHSVLETNPQIAGDFPKTAKRDPMASVLDEEYDRADHILVYSNGSRDSFLSRGFAPEKIHVAPLGVDTREPTQWAARETGRFLFVGRCDAHKGLDIASAAVRRLGRGARLRVAGPASKNVQSWMARQPHIDYLGILGRTHLEEEYRRCHALIAPSIESFGYAVVEAHIHGSPVVCADTTGAAEFLDTPDCYVLSRDDLDAWVHQIGALPAVARDQSEQVTRNAVRSLGKLTWQASATNLAKFYREIGVGHSGSNYE